MGEGDRANSPNQAKRTENIVKLAIHLRNMFEGISGPIDTHDSHKNQAQKTGGDPAAQEAQAGRGNIRGG